jgi:hypothetical protein
VTDEAGLAGSARDDDGTSSRPWTFLTNHAHVLLCVARDPDARIRDIAARVGVTERAAQRIVSDLVATGYVVPERAGRRNHYSIRTGLPLRHPLERDHAVDALIAGLLHPGDSERVR